MPGIITHNKILRESIKHLSERNNKTFLLRSVESLFNSEEFMKAALFGSIGPNIFDYIPLRNKKNYYGNEISFLLHNGSIVDIINQMIEKIYSFNDKNNHWSAIQRAYLYGLISHIVSDSIFHPFVFYFSGFPNNYDKKEIIHFREQNLLFEYNIDNYYLYHEKNSKSFKFSIDDMLPLRKNKRFLSLDPAVKTIILESLNSVHPEMYRRLVWKESGDEDIKYSGSFGYLDLIPYAIKLAYKLKRNNSRRFSNFLREIRRRNYFFSDFIVRYPWKKRVNRNILNLHMGRWQYPSSKKGFRYESINDLLEESCSRIVEIWERIELSLYGKNDTRIIDKLKNNTYTGEKNTNYHEMKIKSPVRLPYN